MSFGQQFLCRRLFATPFPLLIRCITGFLFPPSPLLSQLQLQQDPGCNCNSCSLLSLTHTSGKAQQTAFWSFPQTFFALLPRVHRLSLSPGCRGNREGTKNPALQSICSTSHQATATTTITHELFFVRQRRQPHQQLFPLPAESSVYLYLCVLISS